MDEHRCMYCDSVITNDVSIKRQMGAECEGIVNGIVMSEFRKDEQNMFQYNYLIEMNHYRDLFIETFKDTKFRTDFNRDFYKSMCDSTRISKKQLDIMKKKLNDKFGFDFCYEEFRNVIDVKRREFFLSKTNEISVTTEMFYAYKNNK